MKIRNILFVLATYFTAISLSLADQVIYEPGPEDGVDVWLSSYYDYGDDYGVDDWKLQAGGWGDEYNFLIKFDVTGLQQNPTSAEMWMLPYDRGDSSTLVSMYMDLLVEDWDENTGWYDQLGRQSLYLASAPILGFWYGLNITSIYNDWKSGTYPNYGFGFRPTGTDNQFSQFYSSDLPFAYRWARPKLIVTYDGANLAFPLAGYTPYTVPVNAIVDHSVSTGFNCPDYVVTAYTGERGELQYGISDWNSTITSSACPKEKLYGFAQNGLVPFSINGQYNAPDKNGNNLFLSYDGHTGYDYPVGDNVGVYAAATGVAYAYDSGMMIVHSSGYTTYYLHLSSQLIGDGQPSQPVSKGSWIGQTGDGHLHFTVKKYDGTRVDPYGWKGEWGTDPLQVDGADNVCLWENCQWW